MKAYKHILFLLFFGLLTLQQVHADNVGKFTLQKVANLSDDASALTGYSKLGTIEEVYVTENNLSKLKTVEIYKNADGVLAWRALAQGVGKLFNDVDIIALNKVIPTGANKSYIAKTVVNTPNNAIKSIHPANSPLLQKVDNYIAETNSNLKGKIGEEIAEELVKDMDGFVHYPCKLNGSDNGFDVVAIKGNPSNPIEIRIIESKPMNSGSVNLSVTVNKGTQMDDFWIDKTIEAMVNSSDQNLIDIGTYLLLNRNKITKFVSTINKDTKEIILIKLDAFNG